MTKKFAISFPDYLFNQYLSNFKGNRSKFIEEMFMRGINAEMSELDDYKTKYLHVIRQLREKDEEIKALKLKVSRQSTLLDNRPSAELEENTKFADGLKNSGFLRDL